MGTRLKNLCERRGEYGLGIRAEEYALDGVRLIRTSDITDDGELLPKEHGVFVDPAVVNGLELRTGDLLISRSGTVGRSLLFDETTHGQATFAAYLVRFRFKDGVDPRFVYYFTKSAPFLQQIELDSTQATILNFNAQKLGNLEIPSFSGEEQRVIADFLDRETTRVDALVERKRALLTRLQERRHSVIFHGVTGLLDTGVDVHDPGVPWARHVRKPWPAVKIKHVARLGTGHTPSRSRPELWENPTIPWITTGEIQQVRSDRVETISETRERVSEIGIANSAAELHPAGTVVLCRTASAGFSAIMGSNMATSQDFVTWTCSERLLPRYLLMCLRAMRSDLLGRLAFGSTHKTIYMPDIETLKIPLPTMVEQQKVLASIDAQLRRIDMLVERLEQQLHLLAEHRQALITDAVTGQVDVGGEAA